MCFYSEDLYLKALKQVYDKRNVGQECRTRYAELNQFNHSFINAEGGEKRTVTERLTKLLK